MKRILILLLLTLMLCGCGGAAEGAPAPTFTPMPTATPVPTPSPEPTAAPSPTAEAHLERVPVLMYHQIAAPEENDLYLAPENFQSQLDWMAANGYTPVTMKELARHWRSNAPLPPKPIVLTFDDGYAPMYTEVYPRLMEKGWAATFYIVPLYTGDPGSFVTPEQLREMAGGGMDIGSHTYSHAQLTDYGEADIRWELTESKAVLSEWTGQEVVSFCYPSGRYTPDIADMVCDAGYESAVTTLYGASEESMGLYAVSRLRISWGMTGEGLENALANLGFE